MPKWVVQQGLLGVAPNIETCSSQGGILLYAHCHAQLGGLDGSPNITTWPRTNHHQVYIIVVGGVAARLEIPEEEKRAERPNGLEKT